MASASRKPSCSTVRRRRHDTAIAPAQAAISNSGRAIVSLWKKLTTFCALARFWERKSTNFALPGVPATVSSAWMPLASRVALSLATAGVRSMLTSPLEVPIRWPLLPSSAAETLAWAWRLATSHTFANWGEATTAWSAW